MKTAQITATPIIKTTKKGFVKTTMLPDPE
jgi:hypothetical protein